MNDGILKLAIFATGAVLVIGLVIALGIIVIPVVILIGIGWGIYKFINRPAAKPSLNSLYEAALVQLKDVPDTTTYGKQLVEKIIDKWEPHKPALDIAEWLAEAMLDIYEAERLNHLDPPPKYHNELEGAQYRELVRHHLKKIQHLPDLETAMIESCYTFAAALPKIARRQKAATRFSTVSLDTVVHPSVITDLVRHYYSQPLKDTGLCQSLRDTLDKNIHELSGVAFRPETRNLGDLIMPENYDGTTAEAVLAYLSGTPFEMVFQAQIPFALPDEQRFSGQWIVAPPGRGKTTLLHGMIKDDLERDAALILMDSKGDLIEPIKRLRSIKDRLLLIEPNPDNAFALNPLDVTNTNVTQAVSLIEYIMAGLLDAKFTALQSTLFRNVVPAIIEAIPNPTLDDFKLVMVKGLPSLDKVNPHARQFFENRDTGFHSKTYESTRKEVVWRLDYLLTNPTLRSMFSATHTRLDMGAEMDAGKVIVINNSKAILGDEGAEFFGRFFVALIARAAQQRAGKPPSSKKPCYVYIDECQSVIAKDTRIPVLLDECRSQKIALILSHQRTAQLTPPVLDAVANCAIRMANSDDEAKYLADKLRMPADALRSLPKGTFATFVRDLTPVGIKLTVVKLDLEAMPQMSSEELDAVRHRMRADFSSSPPSAPPPKDAPIVNFNSRPPEMEPWRLDTTDNKQTSSGAATNDPAEPHDPGEPTDKW